MNDKRYGVCPRYVLILHHYLKKKYFTYLFKRQRPFCSLNYIFIMKPIETKF